MVDRIDALAAWLDAAMVPAFQARVAVLGEIESGASNFYTTRLARGSLFADYEIVLVRRMEAAGVPGIVHEIGGGIGSLSFLLAAAGAHAVCFEHGQRRHAAAIALHRAIGNRDAALASRLRIVRSSFPDTAIDPGDATAIATNLVFTTSPEQRRAIIAAFGAYPVAIIDIDRFLTTTGPEQRAATVAEFAAAGLAGEPWLEVGRSACFWRFTPA